MLGIKKHYIIGQCDTIVHEIAERCANATLPHLSAAAERMSSAELRGYVRAHAWPLIWAEVRRIESNQSLTKTDSNELAGRALEQTVYIVARACAGVPVVAMPTPHIGRRTAA